MANKPAASGCLVLIAFRVTADTKKRVADALAKELRAKSAEVYTEADLLRELLDRGLTSKEQELAGNKPNGKR